MRLRGNEMIVHRGESFTIDRTVVNRDGSPFIVSSEYKNPHILITVASTRYDTQDRYVLNCWLDLSSLPRFENTVVKEIPWLTFGYTKTMMPDGSERDDEPYEYLYYSQNEQVYAYINNDNEFCNYDGLRIVKHFDTSITRDWIEQSYSYGIRLVEGESMDSFVRSTHKAAFGLDEKNTTDSLLKLYNDLKAKDEKLVANIDLTKPLASIGAVQIIMAPSKLSVMSDLNGGF